MDLHAPHSAQVARIAELFAQHGDQPYEGARRETVSALAHALQCAQLAEWAQASPPLVAAAFLHDIGHFLAAEAIARDDAVDDAHELIAVPFLSEAFSAEVVEPVRLHVMAKRYLVRVEPHYAGGLSPASLHSLMLQGGPMSDEEMDRFESLPFARDAVQLRRWDDLAKQPDRRTPPLAYYLALLDELGEQAAAATKTDIGARNVS
jgi:phosphonate degradation associated HDIG domain protein